MSDIETTGIYTVGDKPATLIGPLLEIGARLPEATVVTGEMKPVPLSAFFGRVLIISTVPSLDTGVCSAQTRRFNQEAASLGPEVQVLTISNDLPFAQKRFCETAGIERVTVLSDYRGQQFGRAAGLFVKETYLLARAVIVADRQGVVRYLQIVPQQGQEPDYGPVLEAARALL
ncbi:MAG: thiol peroxidase [Candidatus Zixiibacteriota bacterium]|nr:MAG: thiol peroxidase [candidate division Zixibacteria bacterium]